MALNYAEAICRHGPKLGVATRELKNTLSILDMLGEILGVMLDMRDPRSDARHERSSE